MVWTTRYHIMLALMYTLHTHVTYILMFQQVAAVFTIAEGGTKACLDNQSFISHNVHWCV